jgi:hypothetical protein
MNQNTNVVIDIESMSSLSDTEEVTPDHCHFNFTFNQIITTKRNPASLPNIFTFDFPPVKFTRIGEEDMLTKNPTVTLSLYRRTNDNTTNSIGIEVSSWRISPTNSSKNKLEYIADGLTVETYTGKTYNYIFYVLDNHQRIIGMSQMFNLKGKKKSIYIPKNKNPKKQLISKNVKTLLIRVAEWMYQDKERFHMISNIVSSGTESQETNK